MYLNHLTQDGDRWDAIAWRYYGDVKHVPLLIEANPHVPVVEVLPGGLNLAIPVIEAEDATALEELPPWKR
ncbi:phage tail protein X [Vogesella perlucida]|nr:phage tail protein X [Vogesella perlucida]